MSVAVRKPMSLEQFLAWEERQELRYEFDGIDPAAMAGGTAAHSTIQVNLISALRNGLRGKVCRAHGSELKVSMAGRVRYPDAFVICKSVASGAKIVSDPVVVFEILSEETSNDDLMVKNAEYRATSSIQRYVILQQNHAGAIILTRKGEYWVTELVSDAEAELKMPEIDVTIPLSDIYADLVLPVAGDDAAEAD